MALRDSEIKNVILSNIPDDLKDKDSIVLDIFTDIVELIDDHLAEQPYDNGGNLFDDNGNEVTFFVDHDRDVCFKVT